MDVLSESQGKRAILYDRVSTDQQAERYGLDAQRTLLRQRAAQRGYRVVQDGAADVFADDESGGSFERPAWRRLELVVQQRGVDVLVLLDPDRLSRDLTDMLNMARRLEGLQVRLEFLTQEFEASPTGRAFFQMKGVFAEWQRNDIREKTDRGRREKARQGKVVLPHNLPCWLRSEDGGATVVLDEDAAGIVRRAFALYAAGTTLYAMARQFEAEGLTPPHGNRTWAASTLQGWLRNPAAKGTYHQFTTQVAHPKKHRDPANAGRKTARIRGVTADTSAIPVPAVVDEATWEAVQERLVRNKAFASRNARAFYLLSGLLRCDRCGHPLTGHTKGGRRYYACTHHGTYYNRPLEPHERCDAPWTRADWLEGAVWGRVADLFRDPERLRAELAQRRAEGSPTRAAAEQELARLRQRLDAIPREQDRLLQAFAKGHVPEDAMGRTMEGLQKERAAAQTRAGTLERELTDLARSERQEASAVEYAAQVAVGLDALDDEGRRAFLRDMVRDVRVDGPRVMIRTILHGGSPDGGAGGMDAVQLHSPHLDGAQETDARRGPHEGETQGGGDEGELGDAIEIAVGHERCPVRAAVGGPEEFAATGEQALFRIRE